MSRGLFSIIPKRFDCPSLDIYKELDDMFSTFDYSFSNQNRATVPRANISKMSDGFCIEMAIPGFSRDDFNIDVDKGSLNISAKTKSDNSNKNFTSKEFSYSSFSRSWNLPDNARAEGISAMYESGILIVNIPMSETKTKKLTINID